MIILGVDPGTATTGYGVVQRGTGNNPKLTVVDYGCILTDKNLSDAERLKILYNKLNTLIQKNRPKVLAVESIYFFKNLKTAMPVSQAKGVILLAAAKNKIPVYEFTPLQMKMAVVGYGRAEKKQVQKMIQILLNLQELPKPDDAADALGIALCYALDRSLTNLRLPT